MSDFSADELNLIRSMHLFRGLSEAEWARVQRDFTILPLKEGEGIFRQGQYADTFYIVLSGRVRLIQSKNGVESDLEILDAGMTFGEEALARRQSYRVRAEAMAPTRVLRWQIEDLLLAERNMPTLRPFMDTLRETYDLMVTQSMPWRGPREVVYLMARRHSIFLWLKLIPPLLLGAVTIVPLLALYAARAQNPVFLILAILFLLVLAVWVGLIWLDWANDFSIITNRRVLFHERVILLYDSRREVPLEAVLSDDVTTSFLGRMFGFGTVIVKTYTGKLEMPDLRYPNVVRAILGVQRERAKVRQERNRRRNMDDTIRQRFQHLPPLPVPEEETYVAPIVQPGRLQIALSDFFQLRRVVGDTITYRTHWLILFAHAWAPTLILTLLFLGLLLRIFNLFTFIPLAAVFGLWLFFSIGFGLWWLYCFIDWRNDLYILNNNELIDYYRKPLGEENRRSAPLENIQTIDYEQKNIIALLFNYGTVFIRVGNDALSFNNVFNPSEVQREIFERFVEKRRRKEQEAVRAEENRMLDWLEAYHRVVEGEPPPPNAG